MGLGNVLSGVGAAQVAGGDPPEEMTGLSPIAIGTAGWSIRSEHKPQFPAAGTHLERYGRRLNAVEINSSFYRTVPPPTSAGPRASLMAFASP